MPKAELFNCSFKTLQLRDSKRGGCGSLAHSPLSLYAPLSWYSEIWLFFVYIYTSIPFSFHLYMDCVSLHEAAERCESVLEFTWLLFSMGSLTVCVQEHLRENNIQTDRGLGQRSLKPLDWKCKLKQQYCRTVIIHKSGFIQRKFKAKHLSSDMKTEWMSQILNDCSNTALSNHLQRPWEATKHELLYTWR